LNESFSYANASKLKQSLIEISNFTKLTVKRLLTTADTHEQTAAIGLKYTASSKCTLTGD
jgi:hypothetical protein